MCPSELLSTSLSDCGSLTRPVRAPLSPAVFKYAGGCSSTEGEEVEGEMERKGRGGEKRQEGGKGKKNVKNEGGMETKGEEKWRRVKGGMFTSLQDSTV